MTNIILTTVLSVLQVLLLIIPSVIVGAFFTLLARKSMPSRDGFMVFLYLATLMTCQIILMSWVVVLFNFGIVFPDLDIGVLYILGVPSLGVYGIITSGWVSNSKYAFLGVLRSAGQMILCKVVWPIYTHLKCTFDVLSSIALFVKQTIYCLGVEILIVYYQISFLLLVLESFNAWYWFTFLFILLLPVIGFFRFPENPMLLHGLCSCLEPLLLFLRTGALLRFGVCISVGIWFVPIVRGSDHCIFGVIITTDSPSSTQETNDSVTPVKDHSVTPAKDHFVTPAKDTGSAGSKGETPLKKEFGANLEKSFLKRTLSFLPSKQQDGSNDFGGSSGLKRHNCGKLSESPSLMKVEKIKSEPHVFTVPESDLRSEVSNLLKLRQIASDENQNQLDALRLKCKSTGYKNEAELEGLMKVRKKFDNSKFFELLNSEEQCFKEAFDLARMVPGYSELEYTPFQTDKFAFVVNSVPKGLLSIACIKGGIPDDSAFGYTWPYKSRFESTHMNILENVIAREGVQADREDRIVYDGSCDATFDLFNAISTPPVSPKGSPDISPLTPYRPGVTDKQLIVIGQLKKDEEQLKAASLVYEIYHAENSLYRLSAEDEATRFDMWYKRNKHLQNP